MRHHSSIETLSLPACWLTVGVFDGVHRGHREILAALTRGAHAAGLPAVVLTFHPHPSAVIGPEAEFRYLTLPDERAALLGELGVDEVVTMVFTRSLAVLGAREFMALAHQHLNPRRLLVGYDFALGRNREGTVARLTEIGRELGYSVEAFPPVIYGGAPVSSSRIRVLLRNGDVRQASELLGRRYALAGPVVHGDGRGRLLSIPTANVACPPEQVLPANGVYACRAQVDGADHPAVVNIGVRPTFPGGPVAPVVEAHLLDLDRDLYGRTLRLEFVERLRGEQKFPSPEALVAQIRADIASARRLL